jgi:hypothetical protein
MVKLKMWSTDGRLSAADNKTRHPRLKPRQPFSLHRGALNPAISNPYPMRQQAALSGDAFLLPWQQVL